MRNIAVVISSTRQERFADKPAAWVVEHLEKRADVAIDLIDLRDHPLPPFEGQAPARLLRDYPNPEVTRLGQRIDRADGFIMLTAEYNHGYTGALKNAMDHTFVEWSRKPMSFVGWGNVGGARAIEQLRQVSIEFEAAPLRHAVHILPDIMIAIRTSGAPFNTSMFETLDARLEMLISDLLWWTDALSAARAGGAESN
jgi:NAD(P)H-dependent FMN reductase